ncbi:MAG: hypothetical protein Q8L22_19245 [Reyranella sp.]|nr:hypothetical protein [Reyranella sp.]
MQDSDPTKTIAERLAALQGSLRWNPRREEILHDLRELIATVDESCLDALRGQYAERMQKASAASRYKYLDVVFHTLQKLLLARELGLHANPPCRVLDIGTGGGHLPFVCRIYGHQAVGIDVKDAFYDGLAACLGVQRTVVRVEAQTPLPDMGGRFDLITACDIAFNEKREGKTRGLYWSLEDWQFFLNDLAANQLRTPGTIYLKLNKEARGRLLGLDRRAYSREALALAARNGATVSRWRGTIRFTFAARREIR